MKMKKGLLMVVFLLAISSVMAAMSYSSAKVTNAMTGTVQSTQDSLVSIRPIVGTPHEAAKFVDGVLKIDFNNYRGTNHFGFQKDSEYVWNDLFLIKNNSTRKVNLTINTEKPLPTGVVLEVKIGESGWLPFNDTTGAAFNGWAVEDSGKVSIRVVVGKTALLRTELINRVFNPNLVISTTAVNN